MINYLKETDITCKLTNSPPPGNKILPTDPWIDNRFRNRI